MAKIEAIEGINQVNLSAPVGKNGVNAKDDVIAVQALMKYALEGERGWQGIQFPEPTGTLDAATRALIKKYQRNVKRLVSSAKVDGRIDPAKGMFTNGTKAMWTIMSLNTDALATWVLSKRIGTNYIHAIATLFPAFKTAVGDRGIGSLNLKLEGGVGSLGLELE
jgi:hypothetical protein